MVSTLRGGDLVEVPCAQAPVLNAPWAKVRFVVVGGLAVWTGAEILGARARTSTHAGDAQGGSPSRVGREQAS